MQLKRNFRKINCLCLYNYKPTVKFLRLIYVKINIIDSSSELYIWGLIEERREWEEVKVGYGFVRR